MTKRGVVGVVGGLACALLVGCGGNEAVAPGAKSPFPSREALDAIASAPLAEVPVRKVVSPPTWEVELGTEAPGFTAAAVEGKWKERMGEEARAPFAPELRCVAHELARVLVEHGAEPDERLQRLILRGCGFTSPNFTAITRTLSEVPESATDAQVLDALVRPDKAEVPLLYRGSPMGVGIVRSGKRAVLVVARGRTPEPATFSAPDANGKVTVTLRAPLENARALAFINQGDAGVRACDGEAAEPGSHRWSCSMAEGDKHAWIDVVAVPNGLVLARLVAQGLARREPGPLPYRSLPSTAPTSPDGMSRAILEGLNARRVAAHMAPLTLAQQQSAGDHTRLAPHFFHAELVGDEQKANQVALGLLAGWGVEGTIGGGGFFGFLLSGTTDASRWLESAMETPSSRICFFDKDARQVAIGVSALGTLGGVGAVVSTYSFYESTDHTDDARRYMARIEKARLEKGLSKPDRWGSGPGLKAQVAKLYRRELSPTDALEEAMASENERTEKTVFGTVIEATSVDDAPIDPRMLSAGNVSVMVEITHQKAAGAPWGRLLILVLGFPRPASK